MARGIESQSRVSPQQLEFPWVWSDQITLPGDVFFRAEMLYSSHWMESTFGSARKTLREEGFLGEENEIAIRYRALYSHQAIKLALHINHASLGSKKSRPWYPCWYSCKTCTHPAFFLNFLRFCLRNGLFQDLEEAVDFLNGPRPQLRTKDILQVDSKFTPTPEELPPDGSLALIHGRFLGVPHLDQEEAIKALARLKEAVPDLAVVVAVDHFWGDRPFANPAFRASLLGCMPEVDYVTLIDFPPELVEELEKCDRSVLPVDLMSLEEAEALYEDYYRRIFKGRERKFLYVNPHYPPELKEKFLRRCQIYGIEPVGREGGVTWSNALLYGDSGIPEAIRNPFTGEELLLGQEMSAKDRGDPEEALWVYWEWLADHLADSYARTPEGAENFRRDGISGRQEP